MTQSGTLGSYRRIALPWACLVLSSCCSPRSCVSPESERVQPDAGAETAEAWAQGCPPNMARIEQFCVDRYEAFVVEVDPQGRERPHSPYEVIAPGVTVRAKSAPNVVPQGYISQVQAAAACTQAGKRLCAADEFALACRGPDPSNWYPYGGQQRKPGLCNEGKTTHVAQFFGPDPSTWTAEDLNDPRLNQWDGGLAATASYPHCVSPFGIYDCVGNLHEWGSDRADESGHGRFRGGFYGDAESNLPGCLYVTSAHELGYHDYSTGFRCCRDAAQ